MGARKREERPPVGFARATGGRREDDFVSARARPRERKVPGGTREPDHGRSHGRKNIFFVQVGGRDPRGRHFLVRQFGQQGLDQHGLAGADAAGDDEKDPFALHNAPSI